MHTTSSRRHTFRSLFYTHPHALDPATYTQYIHTYHEPFIFRRLTLPHTKKKPTESCCNPSFLLLHIAGIRHLGLEGTNYHSLFLPLTFFSQHTSSSGVHFSSSPTPGRLKQAGRGGRKRRELLLPTLFFFFFFFFFSIWLSARDTRMVSATSSHSTGTNGAIAFTSLLFSVQNRISVQTLVVANFDLFPLTDLSG